MAFRHQGESPRKAFPGEILLVIHDFEARSPDELSLRKGDRIELIERDDDFGDGWYLGKHLQEGKTGLFPEVYTTTAPKPNFLNTTKPSYEPEFAKQQPSIPETLRTPSFGDAHSVVSSLSDETVTTPPIVEESQRKASIESSSHHHSAPSPLNMASPSQRVASAPHSLASTSSISSPPAQRSISMVLDQNRKRSEDSPVMNETLSVIDEHITDMNTPRSSLLSPEFRGRNDSGSEYSSHIDHRLSYINGNETDEEERNAYSEEEVLQWNPDQVAEYLADIGVEQRHCDVFAEQEISGEVLLSMDQAAVFMKELDLGVVGRRLRTWHKIRAFQEEVRSLTLSRLRSPAAFSADASSEDLDHSVSQASTNGSLLPRIPNLSDRSTIVGGVRQPSRESPRLLTHPHSLSQFNPHRDGSGSPSSPVFKGAEGSTRPSAALVREINHSRRHSSIDYTLNPPSPSIADVNVESLTASSHKKHPSFDRSWTMGASSLASKRIPPASPSKTPGSGSHTPSLSSDRNYFDANAAGLLQPPESMTDIDRGYASGGEIEGKRFRNVLRKREAASAGHSRQSSYKDDQRANNLTVSKRHSRFGSAGSIREAFASVTLPSRSKDKEDESAKNRSRAMSAQEVSSRTNRFRDMGSPAVTKLEYPESTASTLDPMSPRTVSDSPTTQDALLQSIQSRQGFSKPTVGLRTTSDVVTSAEKSLVASPASIPSPARDSPAQTPSRTGSTTTSGASKSFDLESPGASSKATSSVTTAMTPSTGAKRARNKKKTSAYLRGLQKISPQEQMVGCDYSGWMKKKSPGLMTTWKPRLFVLRGRRLSYYYNENDVEEKGLIDISSHRVLRADHDILTGLHATMTGAKSSPTSPANAHTPTLNEAEVAAQSESTLHKPSADSMFIFKLVPPRAGLSRAVNFTKPTVHYFALDNLQQGRLWMAALMKATIDRDETKPITSTYQQKTISLAKAAAMRQRPPALMGVDEKFEGGSEAAKPDEPGLNISGLNLSYEHIPSAPSKAVNENGGNALTPPIPQGSDEQGPTEGVERPLMVGKAMETESLEDQSENRVTDIEAEKGRPEDLAVSVPEVAGTPALSSEVEAAQQRAEAKTEGAVPASTGGEVQASTGGEGQASTGGEGQASTGGEVQASSGGGS